MTDKLIKIPVRKGKGVAISPRIFGKLKSMVINMVTIGEIEIMSEEGYTIFKCRDLPMGLHYIPIKTQAWDNNGHKINGNFCHFELNEKLIITFKSFMYRMDRGEQDVLLLLRYE